MEFDFSSAPALVGTQDSEQLPPHRSAAGDAALQSAVETSAMPGDMSAVQGFDDSDDGFFDNDDFEFSSAPAGSVAGSAMAAAEPPLPAPTQPERSAVQSFRTGDLAGATANIIDQWCRKTSQTNHGPLLKRMFTDDDVEAPVETEDLENILLRCIPAQTLQFIASGVESRGQLLSATASATPCRYADVIVRDLDVTASTTAISTTYMAMLGKFMQATKAHNVDATAGPTSSSQHESFDVLSLSQIDTGSGTRSQMFSDVGPTAAGQLFGLGPLDAGSAATAPVGLAQPDGGQQVSSSEFFGFGPADPGQTTLGQGGMSQRVRSFLKGLPNLAHLHATSIVAS
eukprot:4086047-Amphidinium_carterae.1